MFKLSNENDFQSQHVIIDTNSQNPDKMPEDFLEFNQVLWMHLKNKIDYGDTRHPCYGVER